MPLGTFQQFVTIDLQVHRMSKQLQFNIRLSKNENQVDESRNGKWTTVRGRSGIESVEKPQSHFSVRR